MKAILFLSLLLFSTFTFSQNWVDLGNIIWRFSPFNSVDSTNEQRNFSTYTINVKAPLVLNDENLLIVGLEHQYNTVTASKSSSEFNKLEFSSSMLQFGWEHKWNEKSKMLFMSLGRLNSDLKNITGNHFQLAGLALGTTKRSENFQWKYGVYYNGEYFGPMIVPLFGFNWKMNDKWRLKTVIPMNLELSYYPSDKFRTGLFYQGVNASYRLGSNEGLNTYYIDKSDNNVSLFTEINLGNNIWFHLKAGYSVLRVYSVYDSMEQLGLKIGPVSLDNNRPETIPLFNDGGSIEVRVIYRLPLPD